MKKKINWTYLSLNPNAIHLLEKNQDKIIWFNLSKNPSIFVIKNDTGIVAFFTDLEKAQNELKNIYKTTFDFEYYNYEINIKLQM